MTLDDLPFNVETAPTLSGGAGKRPCRRHEWVAGMAELGQSPDAIVCVRETASPRGW